MQRACLVVLLLGLCRNISLASNTSDVTYGINPGRLPAVDVASDPVGNLTNGLPVSTHCSLYPVYPIQDQLQRLLASNAKLIEMDITLLNAPPAYLVDRLPDYHNPYLWVRSTGRQGRSLLILEDSYQFMSLSFLSVGVYRLNATLADLPAHCLLSLTPDGILESLRKLLLNDFKQEDDRSFSVEDHVCNIRVKDNDGYAEFVYVCCYKSPDGDIICKDVERDVWIETLMVFIAISKVIVVLFSPSFIPGNLYRLKYVANEYIFRPARDLHVRFVVTQSPSVYEKEDKVVKLSTVPNMEYFKTFVDTQTKMDRVYQLTLDRARLRIKSRRMLGENFVPVGLGRLIYNNLFRCRLRRLSPLTDCCNTSLLGSLNPDIRIIKWYKCGRIFAKTLLVLLLLFPWFIRLWMFYRYEDETEAAKRETARRLGLETHFQGNVTLYLTPLHALFILIYFIFVVDAVLYRVISKEMKKKFRYLLRKCLRDMRERSRIEVCAWSTSLLVMPFRKLGVLGLLLFLPYLVLLLPVTLPVLAFYLFPGLNLSIRLLIHVVIFMCPTRIMEKWQRFASRLATVREQLEVDKIAADENFERWQQLKRKDQFFQIVILVMCLVSFWSVTFLLMEVISFFVEMGVYTLMGIIVNAGTVLQYITVLLMVIMYGRSTFNSVQDRYLAYHQQIHKQLLALKREEIETIAKTEELDQENTALRVQGAMAASSERPEIRVAVKAGIPQWQTSSLLLFLDKRDTPFTPEKFFYDTICLDYCGAPGPLYVTFTAAAWSFGYILLFLLFVFVVVMAFGDAYSVSSTNQLLATAAGGFVPFLFRYVFKSPDPPSLRTDSVQFQSQFHQAINRYAQNWPVYDLIPTQFREISLADIIVRNSTQEVTRSNHDPHVLPDIESVSSEGEDFIDVHMSNEATSNGNDDEGFDMIIDVSAEDSRCHGSFDTQLGMLGNLRNLRPSSSRFSGHIYRPRNSSKGKVIEV